MILQEPHRALRTRCDFAKPGEAAYVIARLRAAMEWSAMHGRPAAGLAAPQIGVTLRIFVLNGYGAFVNPRVVKRSLERDVLNESCLSLPADVSVPVSRPRWVKVAFVDEFGGQKTLKLHGWDARAAQHELDHLDAILITDRRRAAEAA